MYEVQWDHIGREPNSEMPCNRPEALAGVCVGKEGWKDESVRMAPRSEAWPTGIAIHRKTQWPLVFLRGVHFLKAITKSIIY